DVAHDRNLGGIRFERDFAEEIFIAVAPRAAVRRWKLRLVHTVAEFDVIHARLDQMAVEILDQCLIELPIVHQSAVADRAIEYFYFWSIHDVWLSHGDALPGAVAPSAVTQHMPPHNGRLNRSSWKRQRKRAEAM